MNIIQCEQGHYYDGNKFTFCPHCKAKESETVGKHIDPGPTRPTPTHSESEISPTVGLPGEANLGKSEPKTEPLKPNSPKFNPVISEDPPTMPIAFPGFKPGPVPIDDPPTIPVDPTLNAQQDFPCVGWLICVKGPHIGQDFRLHAGNNMVGRSSKNCVVLANDPFVSRETQAHIIYEPKENKFYAISGNTKSLSYLNGSLLLNKQGLKKNDIIEMGNSLLMFIPCCDDSFDWSREY